MGFESGMGHFTVRRTPEVQGQEKKNLSAEQELILTSPKRVSPGGTRAINGIYQATARYANDPKGREIHVVVKPYSEKTSKEEIELLMKRYQEAKEAKLKVPRTLRFDPNEHVLIMSDLNSHGQVALSPFSASDVIPAKGLNEIPDIENVTERLIEQAIEAAEKGFYVVRDSYFLLVPVQKDAKTDFVIADFDNFKAKGDRDFPESPQQLPLANLNEVEAFLRESCKYWLNPSVSASYHEKTSKLIKKAIAREEETLAENAGEK